MPNGNYVPQSFAKSFSVSRAAIIIPYNKYESAYGSNQIYVYSPKLYTIGVYTWR